MKRPTTQQTALNKESETLLVHPQEIYNGTGLVSVDRSKESIKPDRQKKESQTGI